MINYLAVLVAAIVAVAIGAVWYSPYLFGKTWMKFSGINKTELKKIYKEKNKKYFIGLIISIVMAYVIAWLLKLTEAATVGEGLYLGFLIWIGFVATTRLNGVIWKHKPFKLYLLNAVEVLVVILAMSWILTVWV
jgi:hypothetical protein